MLGNPFIKLALAGVSIAILGFFLYFLLLSRNPGHSEAISNSEPQELPTKTVLVQPIPPLTKTSETAQSENAQLSIPTLVPPLKNIPFPNKEIAYPENWPIDLVFPTEFKLLETTTGKLSSQSPQGWAAKLLFSGSPIIAADTLSTFLQEKGWRIVSRENLESGGAILLVDKEDAASTGILVIDLDNGSSNKTRVVATIFLSQ